MIDADEIIRRLRYHTPKGKQTEVYEALRAATIEYVTAVASALPESREKSHWLTVMEDAQMWANKAIAVNGAHTDALADEGADAAAVAQADTVI